MQRCGASPRRGGVRLLWTARAWPTRGRSAAPRGARPPADAVQAPLWCSSTTTVMSSNAHWRDRSPSAWVPTRGVETARAMLRIRGQACRSLSPTPSQAARTAPNQGKRAIPARVPRERRCREGRRHPPAGRLQPRQGGNGLQGRRHKGDAARESCEPTHLQNAHPLNAGRTPSRGYPLRTHGFIPFSLPERRHLAAPSHHAATGTNPHRRLHTDSPEGSDASVDRPRPLHR